MTPAVCASYCDSLGYPLSGTEYSSEWCVFVPCVLAALTDTASFLRCLIQLLRLASIKRRLSDEDFDVVAHALLWQ